MAKPTSWIPTTHTYSPLRPVSEFGRFEIMRGVILATSSEDQRGLPNRQHGGCTVKPHCVSCRAFLNNKNVVCVTY